jgi:hypothetical protein
MTPKGRKQRQLNLDLFCFVTAGVFCLSLILPPIHGFLFSIPHIRPVQKPKSALTVAKNSLPSKYEKVFVAGGSKGVGHLIVQKLSKKGTKVVALVRKEESKQKMDAIEGVTALLGDAFNREDVENAMSGCDAAITTLGGKTGERRIDYEGNSNVIESAGVLGVHRILLVTSIGW